MLNTSAGAGSPGGYSRVGDYRTGLPGCAAGPGQEPPPVGGCDAWRPRPRRVGPAACRVGDGRAGGRANICLGARGCMRCNESGWLPGGTRGRLVVRRSGASLAAAVPAGRRSLGQAMMHPMQRAAPGCNGVPAGATMMHAAQRHQPHHRCIGSRRDHEVPGHRSRTALRQAEGRRNAARCAAGSACSREVPNVASDATPRPFSRVASECLSECMP